MRCCSASRGTAKPSTEVVGAAGSTLIAQYTKRERKGTSTLLTRTRLQQALSSRAIGGERGVGDFTFEPVDPGTYMRGVVFPDSVPGRATFRGGDPAVGADLQVGPKWSVSS